MIGQVFMFILAGLVFVLILAYGYRAITNFVQRGQEVQLIDFRNDLESAITTIKRDYGSVQRVDLRLPPGTDELCVVTSYAHAKDAGQGWEAAFKEELPLLYNAWATQTENVFLIPRQPTPILVQDVIVQRTGFACMPVINNRISMRVEGTGSTAQVSSWQE
jgi:hypothetical protein